MIDLAAIKSRCKAATPGPWMVHIDTDSIDSPALDDPDGDWRVATAIHEEDREFIAHARKDIPMLVIEIERLREYLCMDNTENMRLVEVLTALRRSLQAPVARLEAAVDAEDDE